MKRHLHDEQTGRTRTVTTIGRGVRVRVRPSEVEVDEPPPIVAARRAPRTESPEWAEVRERVRQRRARLRQRLDGPGGQRFLRKAILALIARGALDLMPDEED